jgi:hypothetical protein
MFLKDAFHSSCDFSFKLLSRMRILPLDIFLQEALQKMITWLYIRRELWPKTIQSHLLSTNCPMIAVRLWISMSPCRWPVGSVPSTCMLLLPPHCTKDVYTPQGSTRDLWTVVSALNLKFQARQRTKNWWINEQLLPDTSCGPHVPAISRNWFL